MALWQIWLVTGILLMIAEMATPGFVLFFFGVAALIMSLVTLLLPGINLFVQSILFAILSAAGIYFFRAALSNIFSGKKIGADEVMRSDFIGKSATVIERISPATSGKVEFNGTNWRAVSSVTIEAYTTVTIIAQENLTLTVEPKG